MGEFKAEKIKDFYLIFFLFIIWRIYLFFLALISPFVIRNFGARFPYYHERLIQTGFPHFIWSFGNFDGVHYLGIAQGAYFAQYTQAFFPLYPILIKLLSPIFFGSFLLSALAISNLALLSSVFVFFNLLKEKHGRKTAIWSCVFLLAFPTSFYFGSVYSESLFFLFLISSFYLVEKKRVLEASLLGGLASATRLIGVFLAPALAISKKKSLIPLFIVPIGFISYVLYLGYKFQKPLYFLTSQEAFGQARSSQTIILLPQVLFRYTKILFSTHGLTLTGASFELFMTILAFFFIFKIYKKVPFEWTLFSALAIITPTLTGTLASMPRYVLLAFPIYISLATLKNQKLKILLIFLSIILLSISTILFTQGYWVA